MNIVILGGPGSGKKTQTGLLAEHYRLTVVNPGELVKRAMTEESGRGSQFRLLQQVGQPIGDDQVLDLLQWRLRRPDFDKGFILDGYPRNLLQALTLDELLDEMNLPLDFVLLFEIETDALMERLVGRRTCRVCGAVYNVYTQPTVVEDVCDLCGGRLYQRADDTEETVSSRLHVFDHLTGPLLSHYGKQGKVLRVDGEGEVTAVFDRTCRVIDQYLAERAVSEKRDEMPAAPPPPAAGQGNQPSPLKVSKQASGRPMGNPGEGARGGSSSTEGQAKKAAPKKAAPKKVVPKKAAPKKVAPKKPAPKKPAPKKAAPKKAAPKKAAPKKVAPKKPAPKKPAPKKPAPKKPAPKKPAPKKPAPKKPAPKKPAPKKPAPKKAAPKKAAPKKAAPKKAAPKKAAPKKAAPKKAAPKKAAPKKAAPKKPAHKKPAPKKPAPKKAAPKKAAPKKAAPKKAASKKAASKKAAPKKAAPKKAAPKKRALPQHAAKPAVKKKGAATSKAKKKTVKKQTGKQRAKGGPSRR